MIINGQAWWLMPVIQHFGRPRQADHEIRSSKTSLANMVKPPSLLKIQKLARHGAAFL